MTEGYADFHSHLVPVVDDGSRSLEDALHSVDRMIEAGVTRVITTPHLRASHAASRRFAEYLDLVDHQWTRLQGAVQARHPDLDFRRGFEIKVDHQGLDLSDPRMRLGGTRFVLVEWPMFQVPAGSPRMLERFTESGLVPIVAHPERYHGVDPELDVVTEWKRAGALLQGNYGSLAGQNGPVARTRILHMLAEGLLDYLCSDFHGRPEYTFYLVPGAGALRELGGDKQLDLLGRENTARLFDGEAPLPVPALSAEIASDALSTGFSGQDRGWLDE